ncbi:multidrug ABC transporter ATP-binding protein [Sphaerisporangium siamense]|uniref:ABC-2 type transport system ATP-binding protein n=1 Tax=Sphaerisporangium siamense TaxID=795645 RepID=A0A7W7GAS5_9ACTN|nr:ATP-binding cassette domain-containing protein [Sphaerisporangium siamense]MBB4704303.1 ABC-2 type transport system ATP-binding protein [Sphaerisporangium siamense]GII85016.1 multidrug ABC transporter ATP-binding protein [Sphaerisporangium siamense]
MIEVRGLGKRHGDVPAVDGLTFDVRPGVVTGFLGPNGAGKSTTMRVILGLDAPSEGGARVLGSRPADLPAPMRAVGALLDAGAVHPRRTARDHLRWLALSNRLPRGRVEEVLDLVGLTAAAGRRAGGFSLGMLQRLGIAAAMLGDPEVLVLDEPVNGLDPEGIVWIRTMLRDLAAEGRTLLVSSHLMAEMALTADRLVVIARGRLVADTTVDAFARPEGVLVRTPAARAFARALVASGASAVHHDPGHGGRGLQDVPDGGELVVSGMTAEEIGRLAAAEGVVLHELTPRRASLEDAFMELTRDAVEYGAANGAVR